MKIASSAGANSFPAPPAPPPEAGSSRGSTKILVIFVKMGLTYFSTKFFKSKTTLQAFENILIVDLDATCWDDGLQTVRDMEIIKFSWFGCALPSIEGGVTSSCHRPTLNAELSDFCQSLTGILQAMVDGAPGYQGSVQRLDALVDELQFEAWASWGQYGLIQINVERERHDVSPSFAAAPHINLKALWQRQ